MLARLPPMIFMMRTLSMLEVLGFGGIINRAILVTRTASVSSCCIIPVVITDLRAIRSEVWFKGCDKVQVETAGLQVSSYQVCWREEEWWHTFDLCQCSFVALDNHARVQAHDQRAFRRLQQLGPCKDDNHIMHHPFSENNAEKNSMQETEW